MANKIIVCVQHSLIRQKNFGTQHDGSSKRNKKLRKNMFDLTNTLKIKYSNKHIFTRQTIIYYELSHVTVGLW